MGINSMNILQSEMRHLLLYRITGVPPVDVKVLSKTVHRGEILPKAYSLMELIQFTLSFNMSPEVTNTTSFHECRADRERVLGIICVTHGVRTLRDRLNTGVGLVIW
jgi:hypothetical protein